MNYFLFILVALVGFSSNGLADQIQDKPFAVVELFSSEGCSSCPPADLLIRKLTAWARQNNEPVYPLIFHVDYWNYLGWDDVFSSSQFTHRQYAYAQVFKDQGVYTPQMIVNGRDAFVGSDQQRLQNDLNQELTIPAKVLLNISFTKLDKQIIVSYSAQGFLDGDMINFALVERGLSSQVTAGENAGRTLHHDNIVREFQSKPLTQGISQVEMPLDKISDITRSSVIVYVQNPQTMLIEAAKQLDLKNG